MKKLHTLCGVLERDFSTTFYFVLIVLSLVDFPADKSHPLFIFLVDVPLRGIPTINVDKFNSSCKLENHKKNKSAKNSTDYSYGDPQTDNHKIPSNNGGDF